MGSTGISGRWERGFMIESVYSNENAEANQADKIYGDFKMPKNIRQIGKTGGSRRIYVEDYVMTYARRLSGEDYGLCRVAVLVGRYARTAQGKCIFISGAVEVKDFDFAGEAVFTNDHWTAIYEDIKKYFPDAEIVGWYIGGPGYLFENTEKILKLHIDNFAGQDKTLLIFDNMEKDEAFYLYENGSLVKQEGYYIYYEKNEEMQNYMIESKDGPEDREQYDDRVSREIRTVLQNKKPANSIKYTNQLIYAAGTLLAVIILIIGAASLNNYGQMKDMQKTLESIAANLKQVENAFLRNESENAGSNGENALTADNTADTSDEILDIEVVPGEITPMPDTNRSDTVSGNTGDKMVNSNHEGSNDNAGQNDVNNTNGRTDGTDGSGASDGQGQDEEAAESVKYYIVQPGDSLAGISYRFYKSANYITIIKRLNNIEDENMIYIGQKLILP